MPEECRFANPNFKKDVMIEAVENHTPEVIIVDEIGTEEEAQATDVQLQNEA